jgi:glycosyltransferase involved in cell wall biosynthesis
VEYLGEIAPNEAAKLLRHAKANLHPTGFREPFGLTVMEAAYSGTPTLAVARGAMPEIINDGHTGILVEDFVEGFHRLDELFKLDREFVAKWSRHHFNYINMTNGYIKAYKKAIKNSK